MELLHSQLMDECLSNGPFSMTPTKQCEFIRLLASSCNEFENDVSNGVLDLIPGQNVYIGSCRRRIIPPGS
jgi:hypothetical protein